MSRIEHLAEGVSLYLGDSREIVPTLGLFDAVVTDPPYGIDYGSQIEKTQTRFGWKKYGSDKGKVEWDKQRPSASQILQLLEISKYQIIWGGNYFTDLLPQTMQWLIWDKGQRDFSLADFEIAWSSQKAASRIFDYPRAKALADGKEHPTQKPVEVMRWCLGFIPEACVTILDPFMGSGTTGVACVSLGRGFTGIEVNPEYFEISLRRISEELKRPSMFIDPPKPAKQEALEL